MISAVVLTKNSEKTIDKCLNSLLWCDELVIIDDFSKDQTLEKIKNTTVKNKTHIFQSNLNDDFSAQRNFALEKTRGDWILFIDSDEVVNNNLKEEIKVAIKEKNFVGYFLKRSDYFQGKWLKFGETGRVKLLRLAKKGQARWKRKVHEKWNVSGSVGQLENPILHYPHQTISEFLKEINYYSTLHAHVQNSEGIRTNLFKIIFKPELKFFQDYILFLGIFDGLQGLIMALMMSFHSFLTQSKLWQLQQSQKS